MNIILSILLAALTISQDPLEDTSEQTVYFFCESRLIDISAEESQHIVITGIYEKTAIDGKVWNVVTQWTDFVNTEYYNDCRRTSSLNQYNSREEAQAQLENYVLHYLDRKNTIIEKVDYEFDSEIGGI